MVLARVAPSWSVARNKRECCPYLLAQISLFDDE